MENEFSLGLRLQRRRLRCTQEEVAALLEVSFDAYSKWERGLSRPLRIAEEGAFRRLKFAKVKK